MEASRTMLKPAAESNDTAPLAMVEPLTVTVTEPVGSVSGFRDIADCAPDVDGGTVRGVVRRVPRGERNALFSLLMPRATAVRSRRMRTRSRWRSARRQWNRGSRRTSPWSRELPRRQSRHPGPLNVRGCEPRVVGADQAQRVRAIGHGIEYDKLQLIGDVHVASGGIHGNGGGTAASGNRNADGGEASLRPNQIHGQSPVGSLATKTAVRDAATLDGPEPAANGEPAIGVRFPPLMRKPENTLA